MGRRKSKLPLELIPNENSRKVTFRKRRNGLLKKAGDLKTLCDVKVCTIVYEKKSKGKLSTAATFPKEFKDVKEIIDKYKSNSSKVKRVQSLGDFYATQTVQVKKEIGKLRGKICEEKYPAWDDRFNAFSAEQMLDLLRNLENKIAAAHEMHSTMKESKQIIVQETITPMAMFQSNQEYSQMLGLSDQNPSYGSMMMNYDWTQFASTSRTNNNIQYTSSSAMASNSNCKTSTWEHDQIFNNNSISAAYGNMDENATFYNPMQQQQQPCMYDSIFSSAASQQQQEEQKQAVVQSIENPNPVDALPLSVSYDHPLPMTMQPSYLECSISASASALSSEYDQQFAASQSQHAFYDDDIFYENLWHFE